MTNIERLQRLRERYENDLSVHGVAYAEERLGDVLVGYYEINCLNLTCHGITTHDRVDMEGHYKCRACGGINTAWNTHLWRDKA